MSVKLGLTYSNNIKWKDISGMINIVVPTNTFPKADSFGSGNDFRARPIKHWRKQLMSDDRAIFSKSVMHYFDTPGNTINKSVTLYNNCQDDCGINFNLYIPAISSNSHPQYNDPTPNDYDISNNTCRACNPEAHVIKSASTILKKTYYTDSKSYLQSRCRTYDQKLPVSSNKDQKNPIYYGDCYNGLCRNKIETIYKPNNSEFSQQGAASSSSRIAKLKQDIINKNGNSFKGVFGLSGSSASNAGKYMGTTEAPYFIKSKHQNPVCHRRTGKKTTPCASN